MKASAVSPATTLATTLATALATALEPLPLRDGGVTIARLIELYMAHYAGRDRCRGQRLQMWAEALGHVRLGELSDDHVHVELERMAQRNARYFAGFDDAGRRVFHEKRRRLAPATINRYAAGLAAVITWAIKRRIAPKATCTRAAASSAAPSTTSARASSATPSASACSPRAAPTRGRGCTRSH